MDKKTLKMIMERQDAIRQRLDALDDRVKQMIDLLDRLLKLNESPSQDAEIIEARWLDPAFVKANVTAVHRSEELDEPIYIALHRGAYLACTAKQLIRFGIDQSDVVDTY